MTARHDSGLELSGQARTAIEAAAKTVVAYSGGCDSQVLLDLIRRLRPPGDWLLAVHVDHGLADDSSSWAEHCRNYCESHNINLVVEKVDARAPRGVSQEAHARDLRYAALASHLPAGGVLLTAHHAADQAETMLLRALRGAGLDGMAAMSYSRSFAAGIMLRPLLHISQTGIRDYARRMELSWVEDSSNLEQKHDRNYLRHTVLPLISARWPAAVQVLAADCARLGTARNLLDSMAREDIGDAVGRTSIAIDKLKPLSYERAVNGFRYWLRSHGLTSPPARRLREMLRQFFHAGSDSNPRFPCGHGMELRRYKQRVYLFQSDIPPAPAPIPWVPGYNSPPLPLPWGSLCSSVAGTGIGIRPDISCVVRWRRGGEILVGSGSLKKFMQCHAVLPWWRQRWPLLCVGETVICIPGLWYSKAYQPAPDSNGLEVRWEGAPEVIAYQGDLSL